MKTSMRYFPALQLFAAVTPLFLLELTATAEPTKREVKHDAIVAAQIMLDRAGFSPGEIDGQNGRNFEQVLLAFQQANKLEPTGELDEGTSVALESASGAHPLFIDYSITAEDADALVPKIPEKMEEKAKLPALGYISVKERIAERFHVEPELLASLNTEVKFAVGDKIKVPNVELSEDNPGKLEKRKLPSASTELARDSSATSQTTPAEGRLTITVSKSTSILTLTDSTSRTIFVAPVTSGSDHDLLPIGEWKVQGVERNPAFNYSPDLFWDAKPGDKKAKLPAGPNNPVGVAWIDISKPHYGIHGTPEPGKIGHTESHGCVRLTNWDVLRLAKFVKPGTRVLFTD
ncbi:MAG: L,D-transpeptidase family protein [Candidatus Sumerlaeaceae bacterium]